MRRAALFRAHNGTKTPSRSKVSTRWRLGGFPPLGYDILNRKLAVNGEDRFIKASIQPSSTVASDMRPRAGPARPKQEGRFQHSTFPHGIPSRRPDLRRSQQPHDAESRQEAERRALSQSAS